MIRYHITIVFLLVTCFINLSSSMSPKSSEGNCWDSCNDDSDCDNGACPVCYQWNRNFKICTHGWNKNNENNEKLSD